MIYNKNMKSVIALLFISSMSLAAPHPTTSSSLVNQPHSSIVFSQFGFKLNYMPDNWILTENTTSDRNANQKQIDLKNQTARISFNYDETKTNVDLETYVRRFLRDYNQFGFEVAGLQSVKNSSDKVTSVILDINQKNQKTKSRQVFFQNGKKIVTATCIDDLETFDKSTKDCNKILGSFYWN
jgi:hypothetical protein